MVGTEDWDVGIWGDCFTYTLASVVFECKEAHFHCLRSYECGEIVVLRALFVGLRGSCIGVCSILQIISSSTSPGSSSEYDSYDGPTEKL